MKKSLGIVVLSLSPLVMVVGCLSPEPPMFDPKAIEQIQKQQAKTTPPSEITPLPTTLPSVIASPGVPAPRPPNPATLPVGPTLSLTLQEVIHRTVVNSLDVRVAGYQPAIDEARILEAEAKFDPSLFVNPQVQRQFQQTFPPTTQPNKLNSESVEFGVKQPLESGGTIALSDKMTRNSFDTQVPGFPPATKEQKLYDNQIILQLTQPLLQNFGAEVNRARITIAQNDQKISTLDFRDQLEKVLQAVEETYWQLAFAQRDVEIQEKLLDDNQSTLELLINRMRTETTSLQVGQARFSVEDRKANLVQARGEIARLSIKLKQLMNDPELPVINPVIVLTADAPVETPVRFTLSDQIETALQNRLELLQQQLRINSARTVIGAARNNQLPQLNLQGQIGLEGLGSDFNDALKNQDDGHFFNYSLGFQFELPIGNRQANAIYQRTLLQHQQAIDQYRGLVEKIAGEVREAQRTVSISWDLLAASRKARFAAEEVLKAVEEREAAGEARTYNFVQLKLDRQAALAQARRQEAQTLVTYNIAISNLEKAKGTLLRYNNVLMKEQKGPMRAVPVGK